MSPVKFISIIHVTSLESLRTGIPVLLPVTNLNQKCIKNPKKSVQFLLGTPGVWGPYQRGTLCAAIVTSPCDFTRMLAFQLFIKMNSRSHTPSSAISNFRSLSSRELFLKVP